MKGRLFSTCMAGVIGVMVHCDAASAITTLTADADSFVQLGSPGSNFGGSAALTVKDSNTGGTTRSAYIRFDVSSIDVSELLAASLDLTVQQRGPGGSGDQSLPSSTYNIRVFGLTNGNAGENWGETTITWNNAPANNTGNEDFVTTAGNAVLLGSFNVPGTATPGDLFTFSNANLLNFIKADTNGFVTLMVSRKDDNGTNNLSFASKENTSLSGPLLNLTLPVVVPEPATASLGLMGMAGLFLRRRRMV